LCATAPATAHRLGPQALIVAGSARRCGLHRLRRRLLAGRLERFEVAGGLVGPEADAVAESVGRAVFERLADPSSGDDIGDADGGLRNLHRALREREADVLGAVQQARRRDRRRRRLVADGLGHLLERQLRVVGFVQVLDGVLVVEARQVGHLLAQFGERGHQKRGAARLLNALIAAACPSRICLAA
jgi:hypothetical protein